MRRFALAATITLLLAGCQGGGGPFAGQSTSTPIVRGGSLHDGSGTHGAQFRGSGNPTPFFGENGMFASLTGGRGEPAEHSTSQVARRDEGSRRRPISEGHSSDVDSTIAQVRDLRERLSRLDADNRDLTNQVAQTNQLLQVERDQKRLMQQQLADAGLRLKDLSVAREDAERRATTFLASTRTQQGAQITANNSLKNKLKPIEVPGLEVRQEDGVVRLEIPADKLFAPGMVQLRPEAKGLLEEVGFALEQSYPRQLIVIEGHTDTNPALGATPSLSHQVSAAQAQAVLDFLTSHTRITPAQVSSMAFGQYRPRMSNATTAGQTKNRRVEIAIYPESFDPR